MAPRRYSSERERIVSAGLPSSGRSEPAGGAFSRGVDDCGSAAAATRVAALSTAVARTRGRRRIIGVGPPRVAGSFPLVTDAYKRLEPAPEPTPRGYPRRSRPGATFPRAPA